MKPILFAIIAMIVNGISNLNDEELDSVKDVKLSIVNDKPVKKSRKRERVNADDDDEGVEVQTLGQQDDGSSPPVEFKLIKVGSKKDFGYAKVSPEHYEELKQFKWSSTAGYVCAKINGQSWRMHLYIFKHILQKVVPKDHLVDHSNRDKLDNTIANLRAVTFEVNARNRTHNNVDHPNVTLWDGKFMVRITMDGIVKSFGSYETSEEANLVRDGALLAFYGADLKSIGYDDIPEPRMQLAREAYNNRPQRADKAVKYGYVSRSRKMYEAQIKRNKVKLINSRFKTAEEAARAVDACIVKNNLPAAKLNFPLEHVDYVQVVPPRYPTVYIDGDPDSIGILAPCGDVIVVDRDKYDSLKYLAIRRQVQNNYSRYCVVVKNKTFIVSRFVTGVTDVDVRVDHRDNDTKNNRLSNLRPGIPAQNGENKKLAKNNTSGFKNVHRRGDCWVAQVANKGKTVFNAMFAEKMDAVIAADLAILILLPNTWFKPSVGVWENGDPATVQRERDRINGILARRKDGRRI